MDSPPLTPPTSPPPTRRPRVLVVEDDPDMRAVVMAALEVDGYELIEAEDGADLQDWAELAVWNSKRDPIDAVVSDVNLPCRSALEVLRSLRGKPWHTPVILMTAFGDAKLYREAHDLGVQLILSKPFEVNDLRAVVRAIVRREDFPVYW
jgi:DNA-binding response OmpR family regulator